MTLPGAPPGGRRLPRVALLHYTCPPVIGGVETVLAGYGVEIGLLIDILQRHGSDRIGQVNLDNRQHRNRELESLSLTAFAIVQVVMTRLGERAGAALAGRMNTSMKLISVNGGLSLDLRDLREVERPPIATFPAYRSRRTALRAAAQPGSRQGGSAAGPMVTAVL